MTTLGMEPFRHTNIWHSGFFSISWLMMARMEVLILFTSFWGSYYYCYYYESRYCNSAWDSKFFSIKKKKSERPYFLTMNCWVPGNCWIRPYSFLIWVSCWGISMSIIYIFICIIIIFNNNIVPSSWSWVMILWMFL